MVGRRGGRRDRDKKGEQSGGHGILGRVVDVGTGSSVT